MARIIHFELPVDDVQRAAAFYSSVFGWSADTSGDEGYWIVNTGADEPGINGAFISKQYAGELVNIEGVDSLEESLARAEQAGATIVRPAREIPGVGTAAYIRDPEGNTLGLFEPAGDA